jgi:hypothetical protein
MRNDTTAPENVQSEIDHDERELAELLRSSGPRPDIPASDMRRIKASARLEWQAVINARMRRRTLRVLAPAAAAALVLGVIWVWTSRNIVSSPPPVGSVELVRGTVWLEETAGRLPGAESRLAIGGDLSRGVELVTGDAREAAVNVAAVRLAGGHSVRVGSGTRLILTSQTRVELLSGLVYVDSADSESPTGGLEIGTLHGTVVDVGTQFLVALAEGAGETLTVRVRSGGVEVRRQDTQHAASAGEEIRLLSDGSVTRSTCATTGAAWEWVLSAAPAFDLEGSSLATFLDWAARETGWRIRYADSALAAKAAAIELHGTIAGLRPDEAVDAVLPGAGLASRLEGDELLITRPPQDADGG